MYIDLSQKFTSQMPVFPGDELPQLLQTAFVEKGGVADHRLSTGMHVGTHMDAPAHMLKGGRMISDLAIEKFFCRGVLLDAREKVLLDVDLLSQVSFKEGDAVLIYTGFGEKFTDADYYENYPVMTEALGTRLVEFKVKMVGLDIPSPDKYPYNVHKILLSEEVLILENLRNLEKLLNKDFEICALPLNIEANASPCRVVAKIYN